MLFFLTPDLAIKNQLVAAPMAGVSDVPFRKKCLAFGAGLTYSEMILANKQLINQQTSLKKQQKAIPEEIKAVQIVGSDPDLMSETAIHSMLLGADLIDINMGCPAKKINKKLSGSALLQYPELVRKILSKVVDSVSVPVTLKMRTGWDLEHKNCVEIARIAEEAGIQAITVHGRTRSCLFKGEVDYMSIQKVKQAVSIPVIANGDITTPEGALKMLEKTGADALMIGRGAQGSPWIFEEIQYYLDKGMKMPLKENEFIAHVVVEHIRDIHQFYGDYLGAKIACKHVFWYTKNYVASEEFKRFFGQIKQVDDQLEAIEAFFNHNLIKSL